MQYQINHSSSLPLYAQVEALLRKLISLDEYQNGKFLPNEVDFAKKLGISRNTVRQATNNLVNEGLIVRKKGVGTKVADKRKVVTRLDNWLSFTQEMKEKGIEVKNFSLDVQWVYPDEDVREFFMLGEDKQILRMERLRGTENRPIVNFISYFHPRIGLDENETFAEPLYKLLQEKYHTVAANSREEIKAISADSQIAKKLKIKKGSAVLFRKRFVYDPGNRPIEYNLGFYNGDDFSYSIEIKRH